MERYEGERLERLEGPRMERMEGWLEGWKVRRWDGREVRM